MHDLVTSREAAELLGCSVRQWQRLTCTHGIKPERELPGIRGAKFWPRAAVDEIAARWTPRP